jgi:hypothetical protein
VAVAVATAASAQQSGTTAPKPPQTKPGVTVAPGTQTVIPNAQVQQDPVAEAERMMTAAKTNAVLMNCRGPLALEVTAKHPTDASKGVSLKLSFNEAASAGNIQPGQCWRQGGFALTMGATLNNRTGKGEVLHDPAIKGCPLFKTLRIENGAIKDFTLNENTTAYSIMDAATKAGPVSIETRWIDHRLSGGGSGPGRYVAVVPDGTTAAAVGCR